MMALGQKSPIPCDRTFRITYTHNLYTLKVSDTCDKYIVITLIKTFSDHLCIQIPYISDTTSLYNRCMSESVIFTVLYMNTPGISDNDQYIIVACQTFRSLDNNNF